MTLPDKVMFASLATVGGVVQKNAIESDCCPLQRARTLKAVPPTERYSWKRRRVFIVTFYCVLLGAFIARKHPTNQDNFHYNHAQTSMLSLVIPLGWLHLYLNEVETVTLYSVLALLWRAFGFW